MNLAIILEICASTTPSTRSWSSAAAQGGGLAADDGGRLRRAHPGPVLLEEATSMGAAVTAAWALGCSGF
jgi:hypothetical protein